MLLAAFVTRGLALARTVSAQYRSLPSTDHPPQARTADCKAWCNIRDASIGKLPTTDTGLRSVDAFFWLKTPGESDGCTERLPNGQPCPRHDADCAIDASLGSQYGEPRAPEAGDFFLYQIVQLVDGNTELLEQREPSLAGLVGDLQVEAAAIASDPKAAAASLLGDDEPYVEETAEALARAAPVRSSERAGSLSFQPSSAVRHDVDERHCGFGYMLAFLLGAASLALAIWLYRVREGNSEATRQACSLPIALRPFGV